MDQGVIKNFKIHYRRRIVRKVITALINPCQKSTYGKAYQKFPKHGTMMSRIVLFATVFVEAGFFVSNENSASTEDEDDIPLEELKKIWIQPRRKEEIIDYLLIDDFLSLDSEVETSETLTELDILDSAEKKNNTAMNCDEDEDGKLS
ncbi:hypothetical protein AVEN_62890-1 [Araneus ventricosus]|uniref:Uncharacterized protein n=1 Tax=Araneus ventricosus TaxID=182803 RepID=A0A4Y2UYX1_ARAVE|nr:hypothetical protein AVEN_62890-1 [Araneus ventricosus]